MAEQVVAFSPHARGAWGEEYEAGRCGDHQFLEETTRPGRQVYSLVRRTAGAGAGLYIDLYVVSGDHFINIGPEVAQVLGRRYWDGPDGIRVKDRQQVDRLVQRLGQKLYGSPYALGHVPLL